MKCRTTLCKDGQRRNCASFAGGGTEKMVVVWGVERLSRWRRHENRAVVSGLTTPKTRKLGV